MWIIQDWAGNTLFDRQTFKSFQDGWDYLLDKFPCDEDLDDYYVIPSDEQE